MEQTTATRPATAYDLLAGKQCVRRIVDRFYDLMEADPAYAELRALHATDLEPMRVRSPAFSSPGSEGRVTGSRSILAFA